MMERLMVTPAEAAELLGVSRRAVYELVGAKLLESIKVGRCRRVWMASIERLAACGDRGGLQ
jgi:excisionase family DNA binding protein